LIKINNVKTGYVFPETLQSIRVHPFTTVITNTDNGRFSYNIKQSIIGSSKVIIMNGGHHLLVINADNLNRLQCEEKRPEEKMCVVEWTQMKLLVRQVASDHVGTVRIMFSDGFELLTSRGFTALVKQFNESLSILRLEYLVELYLPLVIRLDKIILDITHVDFEKRRSLFMTTPNLTRSDTSLPSVFVIHHYFDSPLRLLFLSTCILILDPISVLFRNKYDVASSLTILAAKNSQKLIIDCKLFLKSFI